MSLFWTFGVVRSGFQRFPYLRSSSPVSYGCLRFTSHATPAGLAVDFFGNLFLPDKNASINLPDCLILFMLATGNLYWILMIKMVITKHTLADLGNAIPSVAQSSLF